MNADDTPEARELIRIALSAARKVMLMRSVYGQPAFANRAEVDALVQALPRLQARVTQYEAEGAQR